VFGVTVRIMSDNELARLDVLRDLDHQRLTATDYRSARFCARHSHGGWQ